MSINTEASPAVVRTLGSYVVGDRALHLWVAALDNEDEYFVEFFLNDLAVVYDAATADERVYVSTRELRLARELAHLWCVEPLSPQFLVGADQFLIPLPRFVAAGVASEIDSFLTNWSSGEDL